MQSWTKMIEMTYITVIVIHLSQGEIIELIYSDFEVLWQAHEWKYQLP